MFVKVGVFLITDLFFIPTAFLRPSVKAYSGLWQDAHEIEESRERILSKNEILELYLNEIFLGQRSYGVAAAALNYFNKSLDELEEKLQPFIKQVEEEGKA